MYHIPVRAVAYTKSDTPKTNASARVSHKTVIFHHHVMQFIA